MLSVRLWIASVTCASAVWMGPPAHAEPVRFPDTAAGSHASAWFTANASGEDYFAYVKRHIYDPAGMTRTGHLFESSAEPQRATAYTGHDGPADGGGPGRDSKDGHEAPAMLPERGNSAGGGYSTVPDLKKFVSALRSGKLVSEALAPSLSGAAASQGIAGGSPGVNGLLMFDGPYTLVVLANQDPPAAERFMPTVGRMIRRAVPRAGGQDTRQVIGGGRH